MKKLLWAILLLSSFSANAAEFVDMRQANCLALNIYFEARNQSPLGQYAVAFVTLNRVKTHKFPDTICDVVWQKRWGKESRSWVAQFSWTLDGKGDRPYNHKSDLNDRWNMAQKIARLMVKFPKLMTDPTHGATHYHADYVTPGWSKEMKPTVQIGDHIFYP